MIRHLHIVCPEAPWPADNSLAIDMFYKIEALYQAGVKIHLHYFSDENGCNPNELNRYCSDISIYQQKKRSIPFSFKNPGIVESRMNDLLVEKLNKDDYPIMVEGLHCTGILSQLKKNNRQIVVRLQNDEGDHFNSLATASAGIFKKIYLKNESRLLKKYEQHLPHDLHYACITPEETTHFKKEHGLKNVFHLPVFSPYQKITSKQGVGSFCLYHGDLSIPENEKAAIWLLTKVFNDISTPIVITGKNPGNKLLKLAELFSNTCLVSNPTSKELEDMIAKAQLNVLPSFSYKNPELKLIHALHSGRHCLVNDKAVSGTFIEPACHIGNNAAAFKSIVLQLFHRPFEEEEIRLREKIFSDQKSEAPVNTLLQHLFH